MGGVAQRHSPQESLHLPLKARQMILNNIRQIEDMEESGESDDAMPESLR
jgi:hypothetical protein